jgi:hypothetical protein
MEKFWNDKGFWLTLYVLLYDISVLLLIALAGFVTLENLLPGFISTRLNLAKPFFLLTLTLLALITVSRRHNIKAPTVSLKRWHIGVLVAWSLFLTFSSLLKFPPLAILVILLLTSAFAFLLYRLFFKGE